MGKKKPLHSTTDFFQMFRSQRENHVLACAIFRAWRTNHVLACAIFRAWRTNHVLARPKSESKLNPIWIQSESNMNPIWILYESNMNPFWIQYESNMNPIWIQYESNMNPIWIQYEANINPIWIQYESNMNPIWIHFESNLNPIWTQYEPNMYLTPPASMFKPWSCSHEPTLYWLDGLMHCSSTTPRRPLRFSCLIVVCCNWLSQNVKMLKMVCHVVDNAWAAAFF